MRDSKSKRDMMAAEPLFIDNKLKQNQAPSTYNQKQLRKFIFPPEAERRGASSTLTGSSTLANALRGSQNNSEFLPKDDSQEKNITSY